MPDDELPGDDDEVAAEGPAPATWAGRQAWSGLPADSDDDGEEEAAGPEEPGENATAAGAETGLTEEFDQLEEQLAEDLDTELAGEYDVPADAAADEGPDPADEFDFDEDEGAEDEAEAGDEDDAGDAGDAHDAGVPAAAAAAGSTIEADTLSLADQEEAREAALKGLRDRTAEHAAKRGITDSGKPPEAKDTDGEDGEDADGHEERDGGRRGGRGRRPQPSR